MADVLPSKLVSMVVQHRGDLLDEAMVTVTSSIVKVAPDCTTTSVEMGWLQVVSLLIYV
jgi:hypothetical protein